MAVFWANDRSTLELGFGQNRRANLSWRSRTCRARRPTAAARPPSNGCVQNSRAGTAYPKPPLTKQIFTPCSHEPGSIRRGPVPFLASSAPVTDKSAPSASLGSQSWSDRGSSISCFGSKSGCKHDGHAVQDSNFMPVLPHVRFPAVNASRPAVTRLRLRSWLRNAARADRLRLQLVARPGWPLWWHQ